MKSTVDLSTLVCVCGARVSFHRDERNASLTCAEAIDRQFMYGSEPPQAPQHLQAGLQSADRLVERMS